ncbi:RING-H2 finger protein ATL28-like [Neltuma alba]|uniref:RING-H2 finger protein ATL28-like n=1 Tax=Neltuma alba TaxID=207710 RepID=UPI0010A4094C|nr:RING-H2 finger protein ATL28-like [Prosopis alba]
MASFYSNPGLHRRPISDRVYRSLRQDLHLLHRFYSTFFVIGATGNVYTVTLSTFPSCSCPDPVTPCKHILFVLIRVLGVSPDDVFLFQSSENTLFPSELRRILDQPTPPDALADAALRQRFYQLFFNQKQEHSDCNTEVEDGTSCPICLDEMKKEDKIVACGTCRNPIHEQCFVRWKGRNVNGMVSCVICRAPWKKENEDYDQHMYLNLSAYTSQPNDQD